MGEDGCSKNGQLIGKFCARGSTTSKRVVAPQEQGESTRVTRQRTAANRSLTIVTHDALASTDTTTSQNEEHMNNNDEGKCLCDLITFYEMSVTTLISMYESVDSKCQLLASFISIILLHCRLHCLLVSY